MQLVQTEAVYPPEKILNPRKNVNTHEKKKSDLRNAHEKKIGTREIPTRKYFGPTKHPQRHDDTRLFV